MRALLTTRFGRWLTQPPSPELAAASPGQTLAVAAAGAFVMLGFEVLAHRQLLYVSYTIEAVTVLSIAIMGIAVGSIAAYYTRNWNPRSVTLCAAFALAVSVPLNLGAFPWLSEALVDAPYLLILPFVFGGLLVAQSFSAAPVGLAYACDLSGAAFGALSVVLLLPVMREEGAAFMLSAAALGVPFVAARGVPKGGLRRATWALLALGTASAVFSVVNARTDFYNLARAIRATDRNRGKVFNYLAHANDTQVLYSASHAAARTDIVQFRADWQRSIKYKVYENANNTDSLRAWPYTTYVWDPRVPRGVLRDKPDVFIIGTSGEGVLKPARALGGTVSGVEINPAVYRLISGPAHALCGDCYEGVQVELGDGRTYLERTNRTFDMITMMNAHISKGETRGRAADAEFIHTAEAIALYLDRLTDTGVINWEEPLGSNQQRRSTLRLLSTARAALYRHGALNPADHMVVFAWSAESAYDQILVRKTPWDADSLARVRTWLAHIPNVERGYDGPIRASITPLWFPDEPTLRNLVADFVRTDVLPRGWSSRVREAITDDKPFPFSVTRTTHFLNEAFTSLLVASTLLLVGPLLLIVWRTRARPRRRLAAPIAASALVGLAYLLVEVVFMQQLQILLGAPTATFVVVLVAMLLFSGLGSLLSTRLGPFGRRILVGMVPIVLGAQIALLPWLKALALPHSMPIRVTAALASVAPCAFLMGLPLPQLMERAKHEFGAEFAALLYGINGGVAAFGTIASFHLSLRYGFSGTYFAAFLLYLAATSLIHLDAQRETRGSS